MARSIQFGPGTPNEVYGKFFVIPQSPQDREILEAVDNRTRANVAKRYSILIDYVWQCNTIANCLVEVIIEQLATLLRNESRDGVGIAFVDLLDSIVSIKQNDKAEKEGNINIFFNAGTRVTHLIENGPDDDPPTPMSARDRFWTDDHNENQFIMNLDYHARYALSTKNSIMFPEHLQLPVIAIGYTFLENIFVELLYRLSQMSASDDPESPEEHIVSVNFNDLIEFHAVMKDGGVTFNMRPGLNAKLLIKCDEITEHTMGDDGRDIDI